MRAVGRDSPTEAAAHARPRLAASLIRTLSIGALLASAACAPDFRPAARYLGQTLPAPREPVFERRRSYFDSAARQLSRERGVLIFHDNSIVAHGADRAWYASGLLRHERAFERGEPRGRWRSWFENGALESDATYEPAVLTPMSWWREDGSLSSRGMHVMGLREGEWSEHHAGGQLAARGNYVAGERHGPWTFFDELGRVLACGEFEHGERVGDWEH